MVAAALGLQVGPMIDEVTTLMRRYDEVTAKAPKLEHFLNYCRVPRRSLNHASAFSCVIWGSSSVMA